MQVRLLLGPAGSGKTFRCLAEVRAALRVAAEGPPLVFLAPKQATFQLERQLLADPDLAGYTRLHILSFERLAEFVLGRLPAPTPPLLSEEGRLMVLRALLARNRSRLRLFHATARLPGFAQQLNLVLRELEQHQLSPVRLEQLAARLGTAGRLKDKLQDLALLLRAYVAWLEEHKLQDASRLLGLATEALLRRPARPAASAATERRPHPGPRRPSAPGLSANGLHLGGLWLDGFAEMTPPELDLLAATLPHCEQATLAFCLAGQPSGGIPWLSTWSLVGRMCARLLERLEALSSPPTILSASGPSAHAEVTVVVEHLPRNPARSRFARQPELQHLERHWDAAVPYAPAEPPEGGTRAKAVRMVTCAHAEAEAAFAAREIRRFVRDGGGRYREAAVLVRSLEPYHALVRRQFNRYGIPLFLDRRESIAHHPLAELTRYALRTVAYGWRHEDWFGALKTGLVTAAETDIDRLENEALARGWEGRTWLAPLVVADDPGLGDRLERLRQGAVPPFLRFAAALEHVGEGPDGPQLAAAVRRLWQETKVERTLTRWLEESPADGRGEPQAPAVHVHATVWEQMNAWAENLALAFAGERLPLTQWLPIVEAGLGNLTVGVIPPALDQVLVGAIDRSRNPELRLVVLLGFNEAVFPAVPPAPQLLTEADRQELTLQGFELGPDRRHQLGRERYLGYIACTRSSERLILTYAQRDADGKVINPSPFAAHLQALFPALTLEPDVPPRDWIAAEHWCDLAAPLLREPADQDEGLRMLVRMLPKVAKVQAAWGHLRRGDLSEPLTGFVAEALYGPTVLLTSVSRLEQFAACPFKFFVDSGLRAEERKRFVIDARQRGSFQHEVLARFHAEVRREGRQWRDLTPDEARARVGRLAAEVASAFGEGLFQAGDQNLFTVRSLTAALQDFIATAVGWLADAYRFNPQAVELPFGSQEPCLPAWRLDLGEGRQMAFRGIIDRVDLVTDPASGDTYCVVVDYKSSFRKVDPLLMQHGVQLQLPAYLAFLRQLPDPQAVFGVARLVPAGVFYVNLRGSYRGSDNRREALNDLPAARRAAYQHRGRFRLDLLPWFDQQHDQERGSGQFSFAKGGKLNAVFRDPMTSVGFARVLEDVEHQLRAMGQAIFSGRAEVGPFIKGAGETACQKCDFRAICRLDPWVHEFRRLRLLPERAVS